MKYDYRSSSISQDRKAAQEVWQRVEGNQQSRHQQEAGGGGKGEEGDRDKAVRLMQKNYRAHVGRRTEQGRNLTTSKRFNDGLQQRKLQEAGKEQMDGKNDATSRWHRSVVYAGQLTNGQKTQSSSERSNLLQEPSEEEEMTKLGRNEKERRQIREERDAAKQMEPQYWLEIVDDLHRYGSNLKYYHQEWNETDTNQNFFYWLDHGEGKHLDLEACPRSRLDKERIVYLTAEQREIYRVKVNPQGLLVWAKDGSLLDTSKYHEDLGADKGGVVPISEERYREIREEEKEKVRKAKEEVGSSASSSDLGESSSSSSSSDEEIADEVRAGSKAYGDKGGTAGQGKGLKQFKKRVRYYASPAHVTDRLLRKTINKNTWLYVSDLTNGLFVSIKKTGGFQHSSFLFGARVTSAGLLKASDGKLTSLSPLSGHYRAGTMHFKAFVRGLEDQGVDMGSVSISKSVMTIRGIEKYGKVSKTKQRLTSRVKAFVTHAKTPEEEKEEEEALERERIASTETEGPGHSNDRSSESTLSKEKKGEGEEGEGEERLPGEGKKVEEMNEEERMDRGIALLVKAFERGLMREAQKDENNDKEEKERSSSGKQIGEVDKGDGGVKVNAATWRVGE
ncbi:uncharacterized protein JCM6883_003065 [Sporobolomyces salmoneus]|uniref:uncharacterized protein n=1 Tax=Sporobolomyces salmoneus TaxID=183962 RepID=UPI00316E78C9